MGKDDKLKIDINSASVEDLIKVNGIGKVTADAIVNYREKNGEFSSINDLKSIDEITKPRFNKIKSSLYVKKIDKVEDEKRLDEDEQTIEKKEEKIVKLNDENDDVTEIDNNSSNYNKEDHRDDEIKVSIVEEKEEENNYHFIDGLIVIFFGIIIIFIMNFVFSRDIPHKTKVVEIGINEVNYIEDNWNKYITPVRNSSLDVYEFTSADLEKNMSKNSELSSEFVKSLDPESGLNEKEKEKIVNSYLKQSSINLAIAYIVKGNGQLDRREYKNAVESYEKVESMGLTSMKWKNNKAVALYELGNIDRAYDIVEKLFEKNSGEVKLSYNLALILLKMEKYNRAIELLKYVKSEEPDNLKNLLNLSFAMIITNKLEEAEKVLEDGLSRYKNDSPLLINMGIVSLIEKKYNEAFKYLIKIDVKASSNANKVAFLQALSCHYLNREEEAINILDERLKEGSESISLMKLDAYLYSSKNIDRAEELYKKILLVESDDVVSINNEAAILAKKGNFKEAVEYCDRGISIDGQYGELYANKGAVISKTGDYKEAYKYFEKALSLNSNLKYIKKMKEKILKLHPELLKKNVKEIKKSSEVKLIENSKKIESSEVKLNESLEVKIEKSSEVNIKFPVEN